MLGSGMLCAGWQDGQLDPITARQLHDIQQQKAAAVAREDYDEAKRLKQVLSAVTHPQLPSNNSIKGCKAIAIITVAAQHCQLCNMSLTLKWCNRYFCHLAVSTPCIETTSLDEPSSCVWSWQVGFGHFSSADSQTSLDLFLHTAQVSQQQKKMRPT